MTYEEGMTQEKLAVAVTAEMWLVEMWKGTNVLIRADKALPGTLLKNLRVATPNDMLKYELAPLGKYD